MAGGVRGKEQVQLEKLLMSLYAAQKFPRTSFSLNTPIGPLPNLASFKDEPANIRGILSTMRRRVDLVVKGAGEVLLAEGKIRTNGMEIGQLLLYRKLFASTPEFADVAGLPIRLRIVAFINDNISRSVARDVGIEFELFQPMQVAEKIRIMPGARFKQFQERGSSTFFEDEQVG
jgi:hypothetical protein